MASSSSSSKSKKDKQKGSKKGTFLWQPPHAHSSVAAAVAASAASSRPLDIPGQADPESDPVMGSIQFGMESISKIVADLAPYCPSDNEELKKEITDRLEGNLLSLVESELVQLQTKTIVIQAERELDLDTGQGIDAKDYVDRLTSLNELANQRIAEYKATLTKDILKSHPKYIEMRDQLDTIFAKMDISEDHDGGGDNADAETETEEVVDLESSKETGGAAARGSFNEAIPILDPLTKEPLEDPVRNKICRHVYGKASMLSVIKRNPKFRCPKVGCQNREYIRSADLVEDPVLTAKVRGNPLPEKMGKAAPPKPGPSKGSKKPVQGRGAGKK